MNDEVKGRSGRGGGVGGGSRRSRGASLRLFSIEFFLSLLGLFCSIYRILTVTELPDVANVGTQDQGP